MPFWLTTGARRVIDCEQRLPEGDDALRQRHTAGHVSLSTRAPSRFYRLPSLAPAADVDIRPRG